MNNQNQKPASSADEPVQEQVQKQTPETKKPKLPTWASILGIVIAAIIVVGLVSWGGYELFKPAPSKLSEGRGAGKAIYKNEKYGFEFKHPVGWEVNEKTGRYSPSEGEITFLEIESKIKRVQGKDPKGNDIVKPGIIIYETKVSYEVEKEDLKFSIIGDFQNITIDGVNGVKKSGEIREHLSPFGNKQIVIILNRKNAPLIFRAFPYDEEVLNQILSTFKFLEPDETADWKTYQNEEYGFEIKYPKDWTSIENSKEQTAFFEPGSKPGKEHIGDIFINIISNPNKLTINEHIQAKPPVIEDMGTINIAGKTARQIGESGMLAFKTIIISIGDYFIEITELINYQEERDKIYNQILSTFKFIE